MFPLCTLRNNLNVIHGRCYRYYCEKYTPPNLVQQPRKPGETVPEQLVNKLTKPKPHRKHEKLKLSLIEVGPSSVAERRPEATKINKRTLKEAMSKLQLSIQASCSPVNSQSSLLSLDKSEKLTSSVNVQRNVYARQVGSHKPLGMQAAHENGLTDQNLNANIAPSEQISKLSEEEQYNASENMPHTSTQYLKPIFTSAAIDSFNKNEAVADLKGKKKTKNISKKVIHDSPLNLAQQPRNPGETVPEQLVNKLTKPKPHRKHENFKLSLIEVGPSSVAERRLKATKINKRTLKEAMSKLQSAIQASYVPANSPDSLQSLVKSEKLTSSAIEQANTHAAQVRSREHLGMQTANGNDLSDRNLNVDNASPEQTSLFSEVVQNSASENLSATPCQHLAPSTLTSAGIASVTVEDLEEKKKTKQNSKKVKNAAEKATMEALSASVASKGKAGKKNIAMEEHIKTLRSEHKERRFNSDLEAYLAVCVMAGLYNRAYHTLSHYRHFKGAKLSSVAAYDIVMRGFYCAGHYARVSYINSLLLKSHLTPSACSHALHIASLHKEALESRGRTPNYSSTNATSTSDAFLNSAAFIKDNGLHQEYVQNDIAAVLARIKDQGKSLDWLFSEANFVGNLYDDTLAGVRRVLPHYLPTLENPHTTPGYQCSLLADINEKLDYTSFLKSKEDLRAQPETSAYVPSPEAIEEQVAIELKGQVSIPSVHDSVQKSYLKNKLETWQQRWRTALMNAYCTEVGKMRTKFFSHDADNKMSLYPYLAVFEPEEMVDIMMQEISLLGTGSEGNSPTSNYLYYRISDAAFNVFSIKYSKNIGLLDKFRKVYADYVQVYAAYAARGLNPRVAMEQISRLHPSGPRLDHLPPEWPGHVKQEIGKLLYDLLKNNVFVWLPLDTEAQNLRALEEVTHMTAYSNTLAVRPHNALCKLHRETSTLTFPHWELPMLSPPRPWAGHLCGGYFLLPTLLIRRPPNCPHFFDKLGATPLEQLRPCMDSLNSLACTSWRVNAPVLDVITEMFNTNTGEDLDVPPHPSILERPPALAPNSPHRDRAQHYAAVAEYRKAKNEMHSLWFTALYKISIANYFRDRVFWFPHNLDFRGRAYPCPSHFSHFNSDLFRSLLLFAEPKPLGKTGLQWLKTHVINLTGFKKHDSLEDRLLYCDSILPEIFDSAERPLTGNRWWTTSDEPWQTLAACKELHAALHSPDPEAYLSRLPIHQDGSCNGLQHYAALGRDAEGACSVNLAPSPVPQDVYTSVATLVEKIRAQDAADPRSVHHDIARTLEGCVKRKVVKQTVMTTVYGVTRYGSILQIEKQLKELENVPRDKRKQASSYLSGAVFRSLEMMFEATKEIQDWLTECASLISKVCGDSVEWVTPLGLPIVQPYYKLSSNVSTAANKLTGTGRMPSSYLDSLNIPNSTKQRNAFPPNFIHSLDACHMMLTAMHCHRNNLTFASVHDCYWTHACNVDTMSKICRDQFVALHSEPILTDLSKFICQRHGFSTDQFTHDGSAKDASLLRVNKTLKAVPKLGDFDIELVKKSTFFFS